MTLLYTKDKYFIGVIMFFDKSKNFGFIAFNNCGMPNEKDYDQDLYFNSESFINPEEIVENTIVVFQIEKQSKSRRKAVYARKISSSNEDMRLALTYYCDHEKISIKNNKVINLFNYINLPPRLVGELVISQITNDELRSPENTLNRFKFFVEHFMVSSNVNEKYIFDRDFTRPEKSFWETIINILNHEELLEIMAKYPSLVRYINDEKIITEWAKSKISNESTITDLKDIKRSIDYLPEETKSIVLKNISDIAEYRINEILDEYNQDKNVNLSQFEEFLQK